MRAGHVQNKIVMVCFSPIKFRAVAPFECEGDIFTEGPFQMRFGKIYDIIAEIIAVVEREVEGGELPSEEKIEPGHYLWDHGIGKEGVGVEVCCKTGLFTGAAIGKEEVAGSDFDLLELLVAVLDGKNVVAVGGNGGACERFVFEIGLYDVFVAGKLPLSIEIGSRSVVEKAEAFGMVGRAGAIKNGPASKGRSYR